MQIAPFYQYQYLQRYENTVKQFPEKNWPARLFCSSIYWILSLESQLSLLYFILLPVIFITNLLWIDSGEGELEVGYGLIHARFGWNGVDSRRNLRVGLTRPWSGTDSLLCGRGHMLYSR